jgi:hypothetical protein
VLDGDVDDHHDIQANLDALHRQVKRHDDVVSIRLPNQLDPGDMDREYLRGLVLHQLGY